MINLIGILILTTVEVVFVVWVINYYRHKANVSDNEVAERDKLLGERMEIIRRKNLIIKDKDLQIEELKNEISTIKRGNHKRLRKDS